MTPSEHPKREEQVLVLAAGGLTDKEIAVRLGISPDTVGTYWRRILAKYHAASRTEVVAKYAEERSRAAVENLRYVNECLRLVADHMIEQATQRGTLVGATIADAILASSPDWILQTSIDGDVQFSNRPLPTTVKLSDLFSVEDKAETFDNLLATGASEGVSAVLRATDATPEPLQGRYDARFAPCLGEPLGRVVVSARRMS